MRTMHKHPIPEESKKEEKTKCCDECDEEFFPVHNFFWLRFLLSPFEPKGFIAKRLANVDLNLAGKDVATGSPQDESVQCADLWPVTVREDTRSTAHRAVATDLGVLFRLSLQAEFAQKRNIHIRCRIFRRE